MNAGRCSSPNGYSPRGWEGFCACSPSLQRSRVARLGGPGMGVQSRGKKTGQSWDLSEGLTERLASAPCKSIWTWE